MSSLALPDLRAAPGACRDLARSAEHVTRVDRALAYLCATAPAPPTLLDQPLLGATLCDPRSTGPRPTDVGSERAVRGGPAQATPAHRVEPPRLVEAPEIAARPGLRDRVPVPRATDAGDCAPVPPRRVRRVPAECPPEPPVARAVRGDPTCRVGTAQLRALAGEMPARSVERSPRPRPPAGTGTGAPVPPAVEKLSGPAAEVTRRLGIDVRPSLTRTPRPGPPAPSGLLASHALAGGRVPERAAPPAAADPHGRRLVADASSRAPGAHDPHGRRGAHAPHTAPEGADGHRLAQLEQPEPGPDGGRGRPRAGTERTGRRRSGEPHDSGDRRAANVGAAGAVESGAGGPPGSRLPPDDRGAPEGRSDGVWRDALEAPDRRRTSRDRPDARWPEARPDDAAIEAAMQRVLTDAARRYGIEV